MHILKKICQAYAHIMLYSAVLVCSVISVQAQDPQYSQYYANALYLSPAFAGVEENSRAIFATRYQWPGLEASYISNTISADHYFTRYKSGVGVIASSDLSVASKLKSTDIGMVYAFQADLNKKLVFRPALQLSYVNRSIDFNRLTFGSQYNDDGFKGGATNEFPNTTTVSYADVSAGGLLYSEKFWIGISVNHLTRPNQTFIRGESRLPIKASLFGGYTFSFTPEWRKKHVNPDEEKSITPTFMYKMQGKSDQLDIGLYGQYNQLVVGFWYRGIPIKLYPGEKTNHDALVFLVGFIHKGFHMGYSYDYTLSKLTNGRTGGSHELTLSYEFKTKEKKKIQKRLKCPVF
ncbi:PorP/SprF family type IX secretion system membrane protein [Cytophaga aurantiaca]|uniref:PorP/SprF family type IX secretion system membrane protein n=1 Tax=Cytophaga aurantiaca TaxID=29530 RepID=UPI000379418C|nr:type IX secretion system membrane protein PorP/SprF [Cytophaga aurantiaca]